MPRFIFLIYDMMKFKQFKSWFIKAYPDIEIKTLGHGLYNINREKNSAVIKDYGDHIKMIVENDIYTDELEIVKKCKSLFGYSICPYQYHIRDYTICKFPDVKIGDGYVYWDVYISNNLFPDISMRSCGGKKTRLIIKGYIEGPRLCMDGLQPDPRSTMTPKIPYKEKDKILSILHDLLLRV